MPHKHPANKATIDNQSRADRAVGRFVKFFGSLKFLVWQTAVIIAWVTFNALTLTHSIHFDKYPFILLNLIFSTQAAYAAPLILLAQNRQDEHDRIEAEHDYRTNTTALAQLVALRREHAALREEMLKLLGSNDAQ